MNALDTNGKLFGEVIALRIVLQRVLAQMASQTNSFDEVLKAEHSAALSDLAQMEINDDVPARAELIRMHAERVIDQMHTAMRQGKRQK